jgi:phospholipase/carboxylesterase
LSATAGLGFEHVWRASPTGSARTLLLLHGTGGDEHDLVPLASALDPDANVLSPRGKVLENGMPRFFRRHAMGVLDLEDLAVRTDELAAFVREAARAYRFDVARSAAVGFSNGANIAAAMLFETPGSIGDAILVRAMLPYAPKGPLRLRDKRVLLLAGERDPYSPREATESLAAFLRSGGADVTVHYAPAGHELTPLDVDVARRWLAEGRA